jgi:polysaccharide pyruvyl transferase WcaK-like protein
MGDPQMTKRIGVFGHVGNQNLGDEATLAAVIQNTRRRYPDADIHGFTLNPEDTQQRHHIQAFPIRRQRKVDYQSLAGDHDTTESSMPERDSTLVYLVKTKLKAVPFLYPLLKGFQQSWCLLWSTFDELCFLTTCYKNLKGIDLLIIAGSQQLIDFIGGAWAFPYTLFKWTVIAKFTKTKVAFTSVGAGPLQSWLGKFFIRKALALADYQSYRDECSRQLIAQIGVPGHQPTVPDLVYSLRIDARPMTRARGTSRPVVGINPVPFSDPEYWPGSTASLYEAYVRHLAHFTLWLIQRGYAVLFFPTQLRADPPVINDIRHLIPCNAGEHIDGKILEQPIGSFNDLVAAVSRTDFVVATRFHGMVISFLLNKPVLGIAYHAKTVDLMAQMGQSDYVLDIRSVNRILLQQRFAALASDAKRVREEVRKRLGAYRQSLEMQYQHILTL